jgi:ribosomal-protein-alanine N-acetyltransferase
MKLEFIFDRFPRLESKALVLKRIEKEDVNEVFAIYDNERVFEYCGILSKHNIKTVESMIGHFERDYNKKSRVKLGIFLKKEEEKLAGIIEIMDFNQRVEMVTVGYFLAEEYWGRGIASEALGILVKFLFEEVQVNRIHAEVMPANTASQKVLSKNGFIREGLLRQASFWPGKGVVDLEVFGMLREEYNR